MMEDQIDFQEHNFGQTVSFAISAYCSLYCIAYMLQYRLYYMGFPLKL